MGRMEKTFNIAVTMEERWIPHFMSMLQYMEYLGDLGCGRDVALYADGECDFRPKFKTDIQFEEVDPVINVKGNRVYDAGTKGSRKK